MADFSKQYCDLYDPELPHDFDILKVAEKLDNDYYLSYICEGFGFSAIGKDNDGQITLYFNGDHNLPYTGWIKYEDLINDHSKNIANNTPS
jgi:hypothetical protein